MSRRIDLANGLLWAGAIIAGAILGAPTFLTLVVLPGLAACSIMFVMPQANRQRCMSNP